MKLIYERAISKSTWCRKWCFLQQSGQSSNKQHAKDYQECVYNRLEKKSIATLGDILSFANTIPGTINYGATND